MRVLLLNFRRCLYISSRLLELIYLNRFIYYLSMEFWWLSLSSHLPHFVIIYQLAESVLCLTVQVIKRYVNGYWFQYWSLRYAVNLLPAGLLVADHNPLSPVAQIFFHLTYCLLFFFFSWYLTDCIKGHFGRFDLVFSTWWWSYTLLSHSTSLKEEGEKTKWKRAQGLR